MKQVPKDQQAVLADSDISSAKQNLLKELNRKLEKENWMPARKDIYRNFIARQISKNGPLPEVLHKRFSVWGKNKEFAKYTDSFCSQSMEKFRIAGMVSCMCATLVFYFAKSMITGQYLVGFSVDALVGVIAIVLLIHNIQLKYRLTSSFSMTRDFLYTDLLAVVLCTLLKIVLPVNLDASLIVLIIAYFSEKKRFSNTLMQLRNEIL